MPAPRLREISVRVAALTKRYPELNVIVTYRDASEQDLAAACRAGVTSLVPESKGLSAVLALLRRSRGRHAKDSPGGLTDRELELVVLTGSGHSVAEIAGLLGISPLTVENLKRRVYAKLDVSSSVHAVAKAASLGMLEPQAAPETGEARPPVPSAAAAGRRRWRGACRWSPASTAPPSIRSCRRWCRARCRSCWCGSQGRCPTRTGRAGIAARSWPCSSIPCRRTGTWSRSSGFPAILVHSKPLDPPELAEALACGASSLVSADRIEDHFLSVLRMVGQGYLVVDSMPMRPLIGAVRARWDERAPGRLELPELTARESDILRSLSRGHSIRQTARVLGIAPKTVENVQTRLFRKLGVRNRSGALAVADAFGLLPGATPAAAAPPRVSRPPRDIRPFPGVTGGPSVPPGAGLRPLLPSHRPRAFARPRRALTPFAGGHHGPVPQARRPASS